ncbi:hypothetical protein P3X46_019978 [Hevea brasiliensis]|uniref:DUF4005 domain-containing protein n=1 Tax=Hevea brasiliensis TaxID=3981 RepID=A0ABQ9LKI6_HEVBR|nr:uncharacterized protein LOC110658476 [Hevea brasiliensis]KAJ9168457.1 hypothetical protein P3X46_019978 [Hevea brasiliensis]
MVLPASHIVLPTAGTTQGTVEICDELHIFSTAEHFHEIKLMSIEESELPAKKENPQKEKQISVDPISLRESSRREASFNLILSPIVTPPDGPPPLPLLKPPLISCSLPNSACSSPRFSFALLKKKWKNESQASPRQIDRLAYQHSAAYPHLSQQEVNLRRSKSCAEGRISGPADELDLWFSKSNVEKYETRHQANFSEPEANKDDHKDGKKVDPNDDGFKCGALCMYLPGFGKGKPVRSKKEQVGAEVGNIISRTVSLEKFECGSWASSAIINDHEDGDSMNRYFDLPLELIRTSVNDATSPVAAAFVFDKDHKGVLKNSSTKATNRKSHESPRHVRFSSPTSYPASPAACITPRLRKAREDFNAFLEAQSA